jgi:transposase
MPKEIWTIYRMFRRQDGRSYIGQTKTPLELRRARHVRRAWERGDRSPLYEAIRASGDEAFEAWGIEAVACCTSQRDADAIEAALIAQEGTLHPSGFNGVPYRYRGTVDEKAEARERNRLARQQREATHARIFALDDAGHLARDIAAEVGLGYSHVNTILRRVGRVAADGNYREKRGVKAFIARHHARTTPLVEQAAALEAEGASMETIGNVLGMKANTVWALLKRARQDGRLPPRQGKRKRPNKKGAATRARVLALDETGRSRREIADEVGLAYHYVSQILGKAGRKLPPGYRSAADERRRLAAVRATYDAKAAALQEKMLALDDAGRSRAEIANAVGLSYKHVCRLMCQFGRPVSRAGSGISQETECRDRRRQSQSAGPRPAPERIAGVTGYSAGFGTSIRVTPAGSIGSP